ncbi:lipopolysaccharide biosynthesis protein [Vibrio sp. 1288]|uniref:lipopolysaccharide biosynthesis protein n=1 Tax=Vibrio sp. 1288 TaxID=3074550 RepID=UPI0029666394|nr:lipopolysaccharide biosynthesis protein [Vibrio sp. 1288]MDW3133494.1 lipopolysaccharide biosynthesis protein [Vibrio sp. 1288]
MPNLKQKVTTGLKWSAIERLTTQLVQLLVMLILARLLGPSAFGLIGMLAVFIAISQVFVDSGMSSALIRKLDRTEHDFATAFYFNIAVSLLCYALLYACAPMIATFYEQPELNSLMRWIGFVVIINAFTVIPKAKLTIEMDFKTQAKASVLSVLISSVVGLLMAYHGYGVWSLVAQTLTFAFANAVLINLIYRWRPTLGPSLKSFNELFGFGSKLLVSGLIDSIYQNIYQLIIGKQFNAVDVGHFTQANQLAKVPAQTFTAIIQRVTYPMLSEMQEHPEKLNAAYLLTLRLAAAIIFPLLMGLAILADILLPMILGEVWEPAAILVSILAFGLILYPIHAINLNYLKVKGRSDLFLKLEIIKKVITTSILFITVPLGVTAICIGVVVQSHISLLINTYYNGKLGKLTLISQLRGLLPIWLLSFSVCILSRMIAEIVAINSIVITLLTLFIAIPLYILSVKVFQNDLYQHVLSALLKKKNR